MSPAETFIRMWMEARHWSPMRRARSAADPAKRGLVERIIGQEDGDEVSLNLMDLVEQERARSGESPVGLILATLKALDEKFYAVHPRVGRVPVALAARPSLPDWLDAAVADRVMQGYYARLDGFILLPRGPLHRPAALPSSRSAESMRDRYRALAVAKDVSAQEHRPIRIDVAFIGQAAMHGVVSPTVLGEEAIAFVPVAVAQDDLERTARDDGDERFVAVGPAAGFDPASILIQAIRQTGEADIVIAPEFAIPTVASESLSRKLKASPVQAKLIVAGSGNTVPDANGHVWNEARVYNHRGVEVWRQQKIWPAGILEGRALDYGLGRPGATGLVFEDTDADDTCRVVDIEGFGRAVVLICQDLQSYPLASDLMTQYEPDWVFTPILDNGVKIGRWMHQRAYDLSKLGQSRFVVSSSTSMRFWGSGPPADMPSVGLAVGPAEPAGTETPRAVVEAALALPTDHVVKVTWGHGRWLQTSLEGSPPRAGRAASTPAP